MSKLNKLNAVLCSAGMALTMMATPVGIFAADETKEPAQTETTDTIKNDISKVTAKADEYLKDMESHIDALTDGKTMDAIKEKLGDVKTEVQKVEKEGTTAAVRDLHALKTKINQLKDEVTGEEAKNQITALSDEADSSMRAEMKGTLDRFVKSLDEMAKPSDLDDTAWTNIVDSVKNASTAIADKATDDKAMINGLNNAASQLKSVLEAQSTGQVKTEVQGMINQLNKYVADLDGTAAQDDTTGKDDAAADDANKGDTTTGETGKDETDKDETDKDETNKDEPGVTPAAPKEDAVKALLKDKDLTVKLKDSDKSKVYKLTDAKFTVGDVKAVENEDKTTTYTVPVTVDTASFIDQFEKDENLKDLTAVKPLELSLNYLSATDAWELSEIPTLELTKKETTTPTTPSDAVKSYTITLMNGDESFFSKKYETAKGKDSVTFNLPNSKPKKEGKVFAGWEDKSTKKVYEAGKEITISANTTLYATWKDGKDSSSPNTAALQQAAAAGAFTR